ncbi:SYF2 splicing factor-domain-containing protein [Glomus cerebriforme]|uniref:Pre-mRNA-splicing factor SYF2 n=1 Tax=Glomus cerebriforme TaxID=658196 RepID=A0A397T8X4_9GLOM|nr:SYF2 splicing factor-domain-containing protein [Glomus cerebriforme]
MNIDPQREQAKKNEIHDSLSTNEVSRVEKMKARIDCLQKLRKRSDDALQANRQEVYEEFQRKKTNPIRQERKREAEKLLAKQEAQIRGENYERKRFWDYSAESVEKWEKKQEKKAKKANTGFTDFNQVAHKKYKKQINELRPDLVAYDEQKIATTLTTIENGKVVYIDTESSFYRDANSLQYASVDNVPSAQAVDRLVTDVNKQIAQRERFSRRKKVDDDNEITYINNRNRRFNEKIGRFYDKYTMEIRGNLERGTAL